MKSGEIVGPFLFKICICDIAEWGDSMQTLNALLGPVLSSVWTSRSQLLTLKLVVFGFIFSIQIQSHCNVSSKDIKIVVFLALLQLYSSPLHFSSASIPNPLHASDLVKSKSAHQGSSPTLVHFFRWSVHLLFWSYHWYLIEHGPGAHTLRNFLPNMAAKIISLSSWQCMSLVNKLWSTGLLGF